MSHFTVLVVANDKEDLEKKLLPYHEYECTGIEEYVEFVPTDLKEAAQKMKEYNERLAESHPEEVYTDLEKFIPEYYGVKKNAAGVWGRKTNPNRKWDWWVVGGRWSGVLLLKNGKNADSCKVGELDTEKIKTKYLSQYAERYDAWSARPDPDKDKVVYRNYLNDNQLFWLDNEEINELESLSREDYLQKYSRYAFTYALIDLEGMWHAKADMGWFGISRNPDEGYQEYFWRHLESLKPEQNIFVVDCHI